MDIRRVVTASGADGKSTVVLDDVAPRSVRLTSVPGYDAALVWSTVRDDGVAAGRDVADLTGQTGFVPESGGTRLMIATFPPDSVMMCADIDLAAFGAEFAQLLPGLAETFEAAHPGMHRTNSIDYDVVLEGEIVLELDDGKEVLLRKHDVVIQHANRHAWRNKSEQPVTMLFVLRGVGKTV